MDKIVVLNSGGFDSTILLHHIREKNPEAQIHSLYFSYGQPNSPMDAECAKKNAKKLNCLHREIKLPDFSWARSAFFDKSTFDPEEKYLQMRNLVFLSYALSLAETVRAKSIYVAVLKSHFGYSDTSPRFIRAFNRVAKCVGVRLKAPFIHRDKTGLARLYHKYGLTPDDYFSCDTPTGNKPCGACNDCKELHAIDRMFLPATPFASWIEKRDPRDRGFQTLVKDSPITEMRVLVNNDCQLKCKHCFYGFDKMVGKKLNDHEWRSVLDAAARMGVKNFHFSGKEPLYDPSVFLLTQHLKTYHPECTYDIVTNGVNVPKYEQFIRAAGFSKVFLSVDDILPNTSVYRGVENVSVRALESLNRIHMPVEVFVDLHEGNYDKIMDILLVLHGGYGIRDFYIRTVCLSGKARNFEMMGYDKLNTAFQDAKRFAEIKRDARVTFHMQPFYVYDLAIPADEVGTADPGSLKELVRRVYAGGSPNLRRNITLDLEFFCAKYLDTITVTPDGYVLGCATEVGVPDYDKLAAGNVRDMPLRRLVSIGKEKCIAANISQVSKDGAIKFHLCPHFCANPIDS